MAELHQLRPEPERVLACRVCHATIEAACSCGAPYDWIRPSELAKQADDPSKSTRAAAAELGISRETVRQQRKNQVTKNLSPTRTGRDGKNYPAGRKSSKPAPDRSKTDADTAGLSIETFAEQQTPTLDRAVAAVLARVKAGKRINKLQIAEETGISHCTIDVAVGVARERIRNDREYTAPPMLTDAERRAAEEDEVRKAAREREAKRDARIGARAARRTTLKSLKPPAGPVFMYGKQVWPLPEGSKLYTYDQLFFASRYFFSLMELLHRPLAVILRTRQKWHRMFIDRQLPEGDEKETMNGYIGVVEMLCDLYEANPNGRCDDLHDVSIMT